MVKHVILWKLKESLSETEKQQIKNDIKVHLEGLVGEIDGLVSMKIITELLSSSNADLMMDSELVDEAALKAYQTHPSHVKAADTYVRPNVEVRLCVDYECV
jgi:hypothetical protein